GEGEGGADAGPGAGHDRDLAGEGEGVGSSHVTPPQFSVVTPGRAACPNMVVTLPRGVNQQETERLRRAQVTNLMLISGRHGAERPHRHGNGGIAVLPPVADLTRTRDDKKQVPCSRVEVRRQPLPRVYAEEARFRFRYLME